MSSPKSIEKTLMSARPETRDAFGLLAEQWRQEIGREVGKSATSPDELARSDGYVDHEHYHRTRGSYLFAGV